jgi:hypothetical protein
MVESIRPPLANADAREGPRPAGIDADRDFSIERRALLNDEKGTEGQSRSCACAALSRLRGPA